MFKTLKWHINNFLFKWHACCAHEFYNLGDKHFEKVKVCYTKLGLTMPKFEEE